MQNRSKYNNEYQYVPELPHLESWSKGIKVSDIKGFDNKKSCRDYQKKVKNNNGSDKGFSISLKGLPSSKGKSVYIRFWAALPGKDWEDFNSAYQEFDSEYEDMPDPDYSNSGMRKVSAAGIAKFRIDIPLGYKRKEDGKHIPPHFHYRLCVNGEMGPVHTQFLNKYIINKGIYNLIH